MEANVAGLFLGNRTWPIALDMGTESVRMLQLAQSGEVMRAVGCAKWQVPESLADDPAARREAMVQAVQEMLKAGRFRGRRVVTALSSDVLQIKNVRIPQMPAEDLDVAVRAEAEERFGFPVPGNLLNYIQAGQVRSGNEVRNEVILLAVREEVVQERLALLADMGLEPEHIEAEPIALFRVLERYLRRRSGEDAVSVAVDIGVRGTCVVVARGRNVVFTKFIAIGGRRMTDAVARQLNLEYDDARQIRQRASEWESQSSGARRDDDRDGKRDRTSVGWTVRDAMRTEMETLCSEIALCLRYCSVTFRGLRPDRIALTGGEACDPMTVEMIADQLNMECVANQPLRNIDTSAADFGTDRRGLMTDWALCSGMAFCHTGFALERAQKSSRQGDSRDGRRLSA